MWPAPAMSLPRAYQTTAIFTPEDLRENLSAVNSDISFEGGNLRIGWVKSSVRRRVRSKSYRGLRHRGFRGTDSAPHCGCVHKILPSALRKTSLLLLFGAMAMAWG